MSVPAHYHPLNTGAQGKSLGCLLILATQTLWPPLEIETKPLKMPR